jgi:hypothetical protein
MRGKSMLDARDHCRASSGFFISQSMMFSARKHVPQSSPFHADGQDRNERKDHSIVPFSPFFMTPQGCAG